MEALTISAANLDIIEKNLGEVAKELGGVIVNVNDVNSHVDEVEAKVQNLNEEIKGLIKEIRENTVITNARQNIMYNNEQIDKKYGYYDQVRRTTLSLLDTIENSNVSPEAISNLRESILLNIPNYWLANALAAIASWLADDKYNTNKEVLNALKKDKEKTCIFFALVNLELNRHEASLKWLKQYFSEQNPLNLNKDFITVLDLIATGAFGPEAKKATLVKINEWFEILNSEKILTTKGIQIWYDYFVKNSHNDLDLPLLSRYSEDASIAYKNLSIASSYRNVLNNFEEITYTNPVAKSPSEILGNLIYEYEEKEQQFQKDNLRNNLIIECNGNREEAEKLFQEQQNIYDTNQDLITLLSNIIIYKNAYSVSNETQKIALALIAPYIKEALNKYQSEIISPEFNLQINNFATKSKDGNNLSEIKQEIYNHAEATFNNDDKDLLIILIIANIAGIIGIFITLNSKILSTILAIIIIIINIIFFTKLHKRTVFRNTEKQKYKNNLQAQTELILTEIIDYERALKNSSEDFTTLNNYLNNLKASNYTQDKDNRNIEVGE